MLPEIEQLQETVEYIQSKNIQLFLKENVKTEKLQTPQFSAVLKYVPSLQSIRH